MVYNHFGPEGNVFPEFGDYLTERYKTDWGPAVNYDGRGLRPGPGRWSWTTSGMWVRDYRFDGLRLDAADQIYDRGPRHILSEIAEVGPRRGRAAAAARCHVFAETDLNDAPRFLGPAGPRRLRPRRPLERRLPPRRPRRPDRRDRRLLRRLRRRPDGAGEGVSSEVFVNNGNYSPFRGRRHGTPATEFPGDRFVAFTQNHDQVGNRLKSDRYAASLPRPSARLAAGILLLAPRLPLLFMGEEYGETNPFPFFCDFRRPRADRGRPRGPEGRVRLLRLGRRSPPTRSPRRPGTRPS